MQIRHWQYLWIGLLIAGLTACSTAIPQPTQTASPAPSATLPIFHTTTPSPSPSSTSLPPAILTPLPSPTATPFLHTIVQGETMLGIALRYGIGLQELQAANPQVDPRFLTIGITLTIPLSGSLALSAPTSEPLSLEIDQPHCTPAVDGSAWCLLWVSNTSANGLENPIVTLTMWDAGNTVLMQTPVTGLLNLLPAGGQMLLAGFLPDWPEQTAFITAESSSALPVDTLGQRATTLEPDAVRIDTSLNSKLALVSGRLAFTPPASETATAWALRVLAVAVDANGQPVGFRAWDVPAGETLAGSWTFEIQIASLGGSIHDVLLFAEAWQQSIDQP